MLRINLIYRSVVLPGIQKNIGQGPKKYRTRHEIIGHFIGQITTYFLYVVQWK